MDKEYMVVAGFFEADGKEWKAGDTYEGSNERIAELIRNACIVEKTPIIKLFIETGWRKSA